MHLKKLKVRVGLLGGLALSALAFVDTGHAAVTTYTDSITFLSALPGAPSTLDFESEIAGTVVFSGDTVGGITFTYSIDGGALDMIVSSGFDTTSGVNYLGTDDGGDEVFLSGDAFTMSFGATIDAVGLFVIGTPGDVFGGDFELTAGAGSVFNAGTPEATLGDGGEAFFLGIIDTVGFTSAMLESFDPFLDELFEFNVDDIVTAVAPAPQAQVPEPGTMALFGLAVLGMAVARRRANPTRA